MEIKDKPKSMSVREWITKKVALETTIPEKIIKLVVSHNYDSAYEALEFNNSIEIAGFGNFYYNKKKADREIEKCVQQKVAFQKVLDDKTATEKKRHAYERRMITVEKKLENLLKKKNNEQV